MLFENGYWWFIIMQDRGPLGRVPCLQPVAWVDGWPMLGAGGKDAVTYVKAQPVRQDAQGERALVMCNNGVVVDSLSCAVNSVWLRVERPTSTASSFITSKRANDFLNEKGVGERHLLYPACCFNSLKLPILAEKPYICTAFSEKTKQSKLKSTS